MGNQMNGTVRQLKRALEEMKRIYPYEDGKMYVRIANMNDLSNSHLFIRTTDENTGILIEMSKDMVRGNAD